MTSKICEGSIIQLNPEEACQIMLDPILSCIFAQMSLNEIKNCRYVNSQWAENSWQIMRTKSCIKLTSSEKLARLIKLFSTSSKYRGFAFELCEWNKEIANIMNNLNPSQLSMDWLSITSNFDEAIYNPTSKLSSLFTQFSKKLVKFTWRIKIIEQEEGEEEIITAIPDNQAFQHLLFPQLSSLTMNIVTNSKILILIVKNSANLKYLNVNGTNTQFWEEILKTGQKTLEQLNFLHLTGVDTSILNRFMPSILRIVKGITIPLEHPKCEEILRRLSTSLEQLHFITGLESVLSPVPLPPQMPNLTLLDTGNSQLSFPLIVENTFPSLTEIWVTYWDWVYSYENVPDTHYYWRVQNPHHAVTTINIRFPSLNEITITESVLENYEDFCARIMQKFPSLHTLRVRNLGDRKGYKVKILVEQFRERLIEFTVLDYANEMDNCDDEERFSGLFPHSCNTNLKIWDANPTDWKFKCSGQMAWGYKLCDIFTLPPNHFNNLKVLKLIWISELKLADLVSRLPILDELEVIGDRCIDRFDRRRMFMDRRFLKYFQHPCKCQVDSDWITNGGETNENDDCLSLLS